MFNEKIRAEILSGGLTDHKTYLSGYCRGYYMALSAMEGGYLLTVSAYRETDPDNAALKAFLLNLKAGNKKLRTVDTAAYRFSLVFTGISFAKKVPEVVNSIMEPVLSYLMSNGYRTGCGCCGDATGNLNCWSVNGELIHLCDGCVEEVGQALKDAQTATKARKSNFLAGLVGAVLGALIGCVAWVLIYQLGYIAAIAGLIMAVCAMKGYELLGGHLDRKGVIASIVILIAGVYFANKIAWSWDAYAALKEFDFTFFDAFRNLSAIVQESDLTGAYLGDLAIGYVLTAVGTIPNLINAFRASNGSYKFRKMN